MRYGPRVRSILAFVLLAACVIACRRDKTKDVPESVGSAIPPPNLVLATQEETNERVRAAFPSGVATEDARAEIGTAPAPPDITRPDRDGEIIVEATFDPPLALAAIRAQLASRTNRASSSVYGHLGGDRWQFVEDDDATGPYVGLAIAVSFVEIDDPAPLAEVERELAWARGVFGKLGKPAPTVSMTAPDAIARAKAAITLRESLKDQTTAGVAILAPAGTKFPGRLIWDVAYSAGFEWGDGDYMHWVPSPDTDASQGIGMGNGNGMGYFMPEWVAKNDGSADADLLEMSFEVPRAYAPEAVHDVMVRAATYMARRLGGTLVTTDGQPFDAAASRARVTDLVAKLKAAGLVPGDGLALRVF